MIVCFIDLAYATAQRVGDLLALQWQDVNDEGIYFSPAKTVNSTGVKMQVRMTPELSAIIERCRAIGKIKGMHVIHTLQGQPYTYSGIQSAWKRACARQGIQDAHIHDLRAKALTDIADARKAQALAGHATEGMTAHYRKARLVTVVDPVTKR
jgi:integrase